MPSRPPRLVDLLPGLALAVLVGISARLVHRLLPAGMAGLLGEVIFAVLIGLLVGNLVRLPELTRPGVRFSYHTLLRAAIVLLGAAFSFQQVVAMGLDALLIIAVLMAAALAAAHLLGRAAGVPGRLATLIGVGTAVCGNSAIAATAPVIHAKDEEVSFAIATNTLFGTIAVLSYPILGRLFHMTEPVFGTWAGTAVNDTSQVVATGFAFGEDAGRIATAVKLTRNALMGIVIVGIGYAYARSGSPGSGAPVPGAVRGAGPWARVKESFPLFVLGFLAMALLNSAGAFRWLTDATGLPVGAALGETSRALILVALAGVGLSTRIGAMRRAGLRPFWVGLAVAATTSALSLLLIHALGPAAG